MCPACLSTMAMVAAGAVSAGGLTAAVVTKLRTKPAAQAPTENSPARKPACTEEPR